MDESIEKGVCRGCRNENGSKLTCSKTCEKIKKYREQQERYQCTGNPNYDFERELKILSF